MPINPDNEDIVSEIFADIWDAAADTIADPGRRNDLRDSNPYAKDRPIGDGPMEYIIKPTKRQDFYVVWSTNTDSITSFGTKAELNGSPYLMEKADRTGSSMYTSSYDFDGAGDFHFRNMGPTPFAVLRKDLRKFCLSMNPRDLNVFDRSLTHEINED